MHILLLMARRVKNGRIVTGFIVTDFSESVLFVDLDNTERAAVASQLQTRLERNQETLQDWKASRPLADLHHEGTINTTII